MAFIDYYKVLGVSNSATQSEIKKAYHKLTKLYHPDKNSNSTEANTRYQEINEAYHVLNDPERRKKYDTYGEHWRSADEFESQRSEYRNSDGGFNFGGFGGFGEFSHGSDNTSGFSDFFEELFGRRASHSSRNMKGEDIQAVLSIPLRDAATTHKQTFSINGENIRITVPAGIADGQKIRLKGRGKALSPNSERGDLYITFRIEPDEVFTRKGNDLYTTINSDIYTMILGGEITLPTMQGDVRMSIKPGTQPDSTLRLRGKGFPVYKKEGTFGDLYVCIKAVLPSLNEKQKEMLKKIRDEE